MSAGKATASAPANIAFVKYWGARDPARALPLAPSISMTLDRCRSRTTVEVVGTAAAGEDEVLLRAPGGALEPAPERFAARVRRHLDALREWAAGSAADTAGPEPRGGADAGPRANGSGADGPRADGSGADGPGARGSGAAGPRFRVATENSFPAEAGLASSASGFAALAVAVAAALGRDPLGDPARGGLGGAELSSLARRSGSGSAARSVLGGYVEWPAAAAGGSDDDPRAAALAPASHWALADVVAVVESEPKAVSSLDGHRLAPTSPHFERRLAELPRRLAEVRAAIAARDLARLGPVLEEEAVELHLIAMSSRPPVFYWRPGTLAVLAAVRGLRAPGAGLAAWATMDAGPNVHVICPAAEAGEVAARLERLPAVRGVIADRAGEGPALHDEHLI
jgi:diphosphomevalonate decarboxylase